MPGEAPARRPSARLSPAARWFMPDTAGWHPGFYEWYFHTPLGAAIRRAEEVAVMSFLDRVFRAGDRVLDVGAGTGYYTTILARRGARVTALEPSPEMRRSLVSRLAAAGVTGVEPRDGRFPADLGVDGPFDGALSIGALNYVARLDQALAGLREVLRPGGWAVFNVPVRSLEGYVYLASEILARRWAYAWTIDEVEQITETAGLRVTGLRPAGLTRAGLTVVVLAETPA